jgi:membrane protease YdiL (CAAX protease family)
MPRFMAVAEVFVVTMLVVAGYKAAISFGLSPFNIAPGALMIACSAAGIVAHGRRLQEYGLLPCPMIRKSTRSTWLLTSLLLLVAMLPVAMALYWGAPAGQVAGRAASLILFTGFGEELFFRGYVQSRLNEQFGRRWNVLEARCGAALLITSILFGAIHVINPTRPYQSHWEFDPAWGLRTCGSGLMFGWLRERTGTIWAGAVVHALTGEYLGLWRLLGENA